MLHGCKQASGLGPEGVALEPDAGMPRPGAHARCKIARLWPGSLCGHVDTQGPTSSTTGASAWVCCSHADPFFFYAANSYSSLLTAMILNCTLDAGLGSSACCSARDRRGLLMAGSSPETGFASNA